MNTFTKTSISAMLIVFALFTSMAEAKIELDFSSPAVGTQKTLDYFRSISVDIDNTGHGLLLTRGEKTNPQLIFRYNWKTGDYQLAWKNPKTSTFMTRSGKLSNGPSPALSSEKSSEKGFHADSHTLTLALENELGKTNSKQKSVSTGQTKEGSPSVECAMAIRAVQNALTVLVAVLGTGDDDLISATEIALQNALEMMDRLCRPKA